MAIDYRTWSLGKKGEDREIEHGEERERENEEKKKKRKSIKGPKKDSNAFWYYSLFFLPHNHHHFIFILIFFPGKETRNSRREREKIMITVKINQMVTKWSSWSLTVSIWILILSIPRTSWQSCDISAR